MTPIDPIYIGDDAVNELLRYCETHALENLVLIADDNTYAALGEEVDAALRQQSDAVTTIILKGDEIIADAHYVTQVLVQAPVQKQTYIAVGTGTITDITRFVSHRTRNSFISVPTAPSVDGFTSVGAPLVLNGVKITIKSQAPRAVFVDLPTLQAAPGNLIAAGFGDILGKMTSLADWQLGHLLWHEPFDESIAKRTRKALDLCISNSEGIGGRDAEAIHTLIDGLLESGLCILDFGASHPASGAEHHCSHYWEMLLLREGRPSVLHGAKVGVGARLIADLYARIGAMDLDEAQARIMQATLPDRYAEIATIRDAYGDGADDVIAGQSPFLDMSETEFAALKQRVIDHWDDIRAIAAQVMPDKELGRLLNVVGGPSSGDALGFSEAEIQAGFRYGHYLRNRFTVRKLAHLFGLT